MSVFWARVFAGAFLNRSKGIAMVMGLAVLSHFILDMPMHPPDLALWPHSQVHLGLGLWRSLPNGWWFIELALVVAAWAYYMRSSRNVSGIRQAARGPGPFLVCIARV